jgi:hypothetical protein
MAPDDAWLRRADRGGEPDPGESAGGGTRFDTSMAYSARVNNY